MRAALDHDRDAIGHAVMTDPIVQSHLTLDDAWRLTDAMIEAEVGVAAGMARRHGQPV